MRLSRCGFITMLTLGLGLLTAVPLSVAHAWLSSQAEAMIERVDEFSVRLINALTPLRAE